MTKRGLPLTARRMLTIQALGVAAAFMMSCEWGYFGETIGHTSLHYVCMSAYVACLLPVVLSGNAAIESGASPRVVYSVILLLNPVIACSVAFLTQQVYCHLFGVALAQRSDAHWLFIDAGIHMSVYCALGVLAYMNQQTTDRMLEGVRSAELRRVQLDRQLVESRLATAEAQIDPAMLLSVLGEVKQGFAANVPDAEGRLNDLIQTLRDALRRTASVGTDAGEA